MTIVIRRIVRTPTLGGSVQCMVCLAGLGSAAIEALRNETRRGRRTPQRELVKTLSSDGNQFRDPSASIRGTLGTRRRNPGYRINKMSMDHCWTLMNQ